MAASTSMLSIFKIVALLLSGWAIMTQLFEAEFFVMSTRKRGVSADSIVLHERGTKEPLRMSWAVCALKLLANDEQMFLTHYDEETCQALYQKNVLNSESQRCSYRIHLA
jgi:hypothetical protein